MNEHEIEAIKDAFGLAHISDPVQLRAEIERRFNQMNPLDRAAVQIKLELG
jgi:hypothetical protein